MNAHAFDTDAPNRTPSASSRLTQENLIHHSTVSGKADLMQMFHVSLEKENKRRLRRSRRFPPPSSSSPDQSSLSSSSSSSSNPSSSRARTLSSTHVAIASKTVIFPFHNDAIFLPTAESPPPPHFDTVSLNSSVPASLLADQTQQSRPSSPVWWRKDENKSRYSVQRFPSKPVYDNSSAITNVPEKLKGKGLPKKVGHWCQKTWLRMTA